MLSLHSERSKQVAILSRRWHRRGSGRLTKAEAAGLAEFQVRSPRGFWCVDWIQMRTPGWLAREWAEFPGERSARAASLRAGHPFGGYGPREGWRF